MREQAIPKPTDLYCIMIVKRHVSESNRGGTSDLILSQLTLLCIMIVKSHVSESKRGGTSDTLL